MHTLIGGVALLAALTMDSAQGPTNRPPEPLPITRECCAIVAAPTPPQPAGTNKGLLNEPLILSSLIDTIVSRTKNEGVVKSGPYVKFGTGITGAGWISLGPGYKQLIGKRLVLDVSTAVSWRRYTSTHGRIEFRPFANSDMTVGADVLGQDWTQVQYSGLGMASMDQDRSQYRLRATDTTAYLTVSPGHKFDLHMRAGALSRPRISGAAGWKLRVLPDAQDRFTDLTAPGLFAQPRFWHGDVALSANTLDHPDHPTRGLLLEVAAAQYDDRDLDRFSFRRYDATAVGFVPLIGNLWTIGVRGMVVASDTSGLNEVPFYMMPTLGQGVLRGFDTDRFRDRNLVALNLESRWALFPHLDVALFKDFGGVARRFDELNWDHFESSYGIGLRLHTGAKTFFRVDAARSGRDNGWKLQIRLTESLKYSTNQRWQTVVPNVR